MTQNMALLCSQNILNIYSLDTHVLYVEARGVGMWVLYQSCLLCLYDSKDKDGRKKTALSFNWQKKPIKHNQI